MTVSLSGSQGNADDNMTICTAAATNWAGCGGAGYDWKFSNCARTAPSTGQLNWSCQFTAPSAQINGGYKVNYQIHGADTNIGASAHFDVSGAVSSACTSSVGGPVPTPCPFNNPAPAGYHWNLTFDDEFTSDSSLASSWNPQIGQDPSGPPATGDYISCCSPTTGLAIMGPTNSIPAGNWNYWTRISSAAGGDTTNGFGQRFGYFETSAKYPTDVSGEGDGYHVDIYFRARGDWEGEIDLCERVQSTNPASRNYCGPSIVAPITTCLGCSDNASPNYFTSGGPLDDQFHTIALKWDNNGSAHGIVSMFLDGVNWSSAGNSPYALQSADWDNGIVWVMIFRTCLPSGSYWDAGTPCTSNTSFNNPFYFQYVRVWQLVAG